MILLRLKITGLLVLTLCAGCQAARLPLSPPSPEATTLTIEATALAAGEFALEGTTNLPDNTRLTAIALRHLVPQPATAGEQPFYSVLDYQPVTVVNGAWSAQLNLWRVAADGRYQEAWQAQLDTLELVAQPSATVQFAVTVAPHHVGAALSNRLTQAGRQRLAGVLRVTADGEPFLWVDRAIAVELPSGQTTPAVDLLARTNGGWGDRHLLVPEPPLPYTLTPLNERQTNAPPTPGELLR
ncbi:hypothetical protein PGN35_007160 [Nodosilinea sp. PGN35]|uniref:hypothetical protein n=1 Tax=Nodosilinea sp. PGN35 TaxID=3020489 RepID=UPI0023B2E9B0|nr:hypothetical protein [Nodosilinea sp. TSF1-S3]MDF0365918.1 hypothetical protein [Nodosilinea sp. TSF1-S3]